MRRIYESSALHRDDDDPFSPGERGEKPQAMRSVPSRLLSNLLIPESLRQYAVSVAVRSPKTVYPERTRIPFTITMKNQMPFPIALRTDTPLVWSWDVNGVAEASHVSLREPSDDSGVLQFSRGERIVVTRHWDQTFRVSETKWERAGPGEYTIGAGINRENATECGLYDQVTVTIEPDRGR